MKHEVLCICGTHVPAILNHKNWTRLAGGAKTSKKGYICTFKNTQKPLLCEGLWKTSKNQIHLAISPGKTTLESNIFSRFWVFLCLGLHWKNFHLLFARKFFPDFPTFIVTPQKKIRTKPQCKIFHKFCYPACLGLPWKI